MDNNFFHEPESKINSRRISKSGRPTIGFLVSLSTGPSGFQDLVWKGMIESAKERDVNAIVLSGGWIGNVTGDLNNQSRNIVHDLISVKQIDGLVIDWSIGSYITPAEFSAFCKKLYPLPIVSIFGKIEGYTRIRADNKTGLRNLIMHLVKDHKYESIAFIKGWQGHTDAEDRYAVYVDTLKECGIAFDPEMVYNGDFMEPSGRLAVESLLVERKKKVQAIVASNDAMAFGAIEGLHILGKNVPEDIAVTGFDDSERAGICFPPLTTVKQRFDSIGETAIDVLLGIIEGKTGPDSVHVPVQLVVRESCGCSSSYVVQAAQAGKVRIPEGPGITPASKQAIADSILEGVPAASIVADRNILDGMLKALVEDTENTRQNALVTELRKVINERVRGGNDVFPLVQIVTGLKGHIPALWAEKEKILIAENRIAQAYIVIGESEKRVQENLRIEKERKAKDLREVGQALITTFDFNTLKSIVKTHLERLGIRSAFISLFKTLNKQEDGSTAFLVYTSDSDTDTARIEKEHAAHSLPPKSFFPANRRYSYSVHPLNFRDNRFGYIMFEVGPEDGLVYDALDVQIASALMGSELLQQQMRTESALEKKTDTIEGLVRPMIDSIDGVMKIIRKKLSAISELVNLTEENNSKLKSTNNSIELIARKIYNMSGIINIIEDVSSSVHILAINTSIEATHAGSFGKGFSVIATELRKLADSIKLNVEAISTLVMGIRPDMEISKKAGSDSLEAFIHLEKDVLELSDTFNIIIQSMEDLASNSSKILSIMND
jgi:DNA-binding LacI/PurR family transcriptional regulator